MIFKISMDKQTVYLIITKKNNGTSNATIIVLHYKYFVTS